MWLEVWCGRGALLWTWGSVPPVPASGCASGQLLQVPGPGLLLCRMGEERRGDAGPEDPDGHLGELQRPQLCSLPLASVSRIQDTYQHVPAPCPLNPPAPVFFLYKRTLCLVPAAPGSPRYQQVRAPSVGQRFAPAHSEVTWGAGQGRGRGMGPVGGAEAGGRGLRLLLTAAVALPVGGWEEQEEKHAALRGGERPAANTRAGPRPQQETGRGWSQWSDVFLSRKSWALSSSVLRWAGVRSPDLAVCTPPRGSWATFGRGRGQNVDILCQVGGREGSAAVQKSLAFSPLDSLSPDFVFTLSPPTKGQVASLSSLEERDSASRVLEGPDSA